MKNPNKVIIIIIICSKGYLFSCIDLMLSFSMTVLSRQTTCAKGHSSIYFLKNFLVFSSSVLEMPWAFNNNNNNNNNNRISTAPYSHNFSGTRYQVSSTLSVSYHHLHTVFVLTCTYEILFSIVNVVETRRRIVVTC